MTDDLQRLILELETMAQDAADRADDRTEYPPLQRSYYSGVTFAYEDTIDRLSAILAKQMAGKQTWLFAMRRRTRYTILSHL